MIKKRLSNKILKLLGENNWGTAQGIANKLDIKLSLTEKILKNLVFNKQLHVTDLNGYYFYHKN